MPRTTGAEADDPFLRLEQPDRVSRLGAAEETRRSRWAAFARRRTGPVARPCCTRACVVQVLPSVRGLAPAFAFCAAGFVRWDVASIRRAQRCTPDSRVRAVRGDSAHVMHSRMYFGHSGMHVTRSARAWRGSCMHRRKAGLRRPSAKPTRAMGLGCGPQAPLRTPMATPEKRK